MFISLKKSQKFQKGSLLWLIFFEPKRELFKEINWRTIFLLQPLKDSLPISKPILVNTQKVFPNQSLLCLPLNLNSWSKEAYQYWKQMDRPSLRVFIPLGGDEKDLEQAWPSFETFYKMSYYKEHD